MKKANKKATKGVKQAWKKGQSASYNPKYNRFRLEARRRALFENKGNSNLTASKLEQHNKLSHDEQCKECQDDDLLSIGGYTSITEFTNCSLSTFERLLDNWNASSFLHKEMVAVLAACAEVLKANGEKETNTRYYTALMTTLHTVDTDKEITAVVCLLSMVVKRLDVDVLKVQCDSACVIFINLLVKYMNSTYWPLLTNLLKIVCLFLQVKNEWPQSTCEKLKYLLEFTVHHKPKVRKTAQKIICTLIVDRAPKSESFHPGCAITEQFCISKLNGEKGISGKSTPKDVFYVLSLLEEILFALPKSSIKFICETILRVMILSNSMVTLACLKTLTAFFRWGPNEENLPTDLNARLITALYDYQPNVKDTSLIIEWMQLLEAAFVNLGRLDEKLCIAHLPKLFGISVKYLQNEDVEVLKVVTSVLRELLYCCIMPSGDVFQDFLSNDAVNNPMHKMFHIVEECLGYQYHRAWKYVLMVLATFFEIMGEHCYTVMFKCLQSLGNMRDSYKFPYMPELDKAVGIAVQYIGPRIVLQAIPLQINGNSDKLDFPRSWLLPLLKKYVKRTELQFFVKYFMPLAAKLRNKAHSLQKEQKIVESELYHTLVRQIWDLLPAFCNEPTDLKQCFKEFARTLGIILNGEPVLRSTVLRSLRILIRKNLENEENRKELSKFSKNYLPILFNLYSTETKTKDEEIVRLAVYDTCKAYLKITDKELCKTFFDKALEKLMTSEPTDFLQQCIIDICRAIIPYVDVSQINSIYEYCKPLLTDSNHTTQKKAYSVLNVICSSESESCNLFVRENLENIRPLLCDSISGLIPATRALRLNMLANIIKQLPESEKPFVVSVIPEAVLCTKGSKKSTDVAHNLLKVIGHTFLRWQNNNRKALYEYLRILLAGFAGDPHLISATNLAIAQILHNFIDKMDSRLISLFIENACLLLTSKSREVVDSVISFLKVLFSSVHNDDLAQHVEPLVKALSSISEDHQRHFRFLAKSLLRRLVRKFGYEMVHKFVPSDREKQLNHIRKMEARKARKRLEKDEDDDDDDSELPNERKASEGMEAILADSDDEIPLEADTERPLRSRKKRKIIETVIEEREDEIVDFLDPSISQKLLTKEPEKATVKKTTKDFPMSEDGRLIITEDGDNISISKTGDKKMDERNEILAELALFKQNKRKREESDDDEKKVESGPSSVTKGIHRTLEPQKQKRAPGAEFKAKKAGGDVKKGKFQPYAYVPLNRWLLNKRKILRSKGKFRNLLRSAKKGAQVGIKRKMRIARMKNNKK